MIRWIRIAAVAIAVLAFIGLGVGVGLFLVANGRWVAIDVPPWLTGIFGKGGVDLWLPALLLGWILGVLAVAAMLLGSMVYVWRRRQYESLIRRLERELADLRNLPFTNPAPLEDLPERPDAETARLFAGLDEDEIEVER